MAKIEKFEDMEAWQQAREIARKVHIVESIQNIDTSSSFE
jgi:hypothetical protein